MIQSKKIFSINVQWTPHLPATLGCADRDRPLTRGITAQSTQCRPAKARRGGGIRKAEKHVINQTEKRKCVFRRKSLLDSSHLSLSLSLSLSHAHTALWKDGKKIFITGHSLHTRPHMHNHNKHIILYIFTYGQHCCEPPAPSLASLLLSLNIPTHTYFIVWVKFYEIHSPGKWNWKISFGNPP